MNEAFYEHLSLLYKLHLLFKQGLNDSEEADRLRETMDRTWKQLSLEQMNYIRGYSEYLYNEA